MTRTHVHDYEVMKNLPIPEIRVQPSASLNKVGKIIEGKIIFLKSPFGMILPSIILPISSPSASQ